MPTSVRMKTSVAALLKRCCGLTAAAHTGAYCRPSMVTGIACISALPAGVITGCGSECWPILPPTRIWNMGFWTARLSVRIRVLRALKKKGTADEQALGRSRGGFSTKLHVLVDGLGNPLRLRAGQCHDSPHAPTLLEGLTFERVIADRGYAGQAVIDLVLARGAEPVIPPHPRAKAPRDYDRWWYRERHLVEWFINKIKHFRRVFSRFDKLAHRYLGFVQFTSVLIWLR